MSPFKEKRMPIYAKKISLQVSSRMLGRLHAIAEQEELSLSEFTRWAIRDKIRELSLHEIVKNENA